MASDSASGNKRIYQLVTVIVLLVGILIALVLFYQKKTAPLKDVEAEIPRGITHIASMYGPAAGDNFDKPESAAQDKDGNIYVADTGKHRIVEFNSDGNFIRKFGDMKSTPYPLSIAISDSGRMYVTSMMFQQLIILNKDGKLEKRFPFKNKEEIPLRVIIHDNKLYMTTIGKIMILDMDGNIKQRYAREGRPLGTLQYPNGIAIGSKGDLKDKMIISDSNNNRVQIFTMQGKPFAYMGKPPKSLKDTGMFFGLPTGLALDEEERVFIADSFNHTIRVLGNNGDDYGEIGEQGSTDGKFFYPTDIKYVSGKRFIVTDKWNDRVQIVEVEVGSKPKPAEPKPGL